MNWIAWVVYVGIFLSAAIEGEIVYVSAVVAAVFGAIPIKLWNTEYVVKLNPIAVLVAGAMGGSAGDQFYFYALRSGLVRWLDRFPAIVKRRDKIRDRVLQHANLMILMSRFLPGLRIAIPAACAYAGVSPFRFTALSIFSGIAWAAALMGVIMYLGPKSLGELGVQAWWTPVIPAVLVILFFQWLSRTESRD